ncbi:MAG: hypothetical protein JSW46_01310 [Gemmatimonadota bacterium]|nr:MAG: hypothetical protein JSW46_01310 [Gemmatimonadota bacterium]
MRRFQICSRWLVFGMGTLAATTVACGGGGDEPVPTPGFGVLSGQTVLVLPVQYVQRVPGGWLGGAANAQDAARSADTEITFALHEVSGRANWVTPDQQMDELSRRPSVDVVPYLLSAGEARQQGGRLRHVRDPLYGEIRMLAALFDARYAVFPMEFFYEQGREGEGGHLAIRTFVLDARAGTVIWYGIVRGDGTQPPASPGALAAAAQKFAVQVSP